MKRRLAAILAADIAGYTKLVDSDEERTLSRVNSLRTEIIEPLVAGHHGRIVKVMGDGFLIEFASAVEAVNCAAEWQERVEASQQAEASIDRLQFRIGVNLGDVLVDENDIHGDGVIIATRLEALADVDGILISEAVFQSVRAKTPLAFEALGERSVKNISEPVRVHRVLRGATAGSESRTLSLPEKPSIAVLPFANLSDDLDQAYFADGLTQDIITGLSRVRQLFVIAHGSTRSYKEKPADVQQVGRELGVSYVLHGSVRRSGKRVRITTQLIDSQSRNQVWAEKYDRPLTDFFDLQDEITRNVVATITTEVSLSEARLSRPRPMRDLGVWDLVKRAWGCLYESTPASIAQAEELTKEAIKRDPTCAAAYWMRSDASLSGALMAGAQDLKEAATRAREFAAQAIALDGEDENAHWAYGIACLNLYDHDVAIAAFRRALEINPNCSIALGLLGSGLIYGGWPDEGIGHSQTAIRANPRDPSNFFRYADIATGHFAAGHYEAAAEWGEQTIRRKPDFHEGYVIAAASRALQGESERAREIASEMRTRFPDLTLARISAAFMFRDRSHVVRLEDGLRRANFEA